MAARGESQLADVMRRMLEPDQENLFDLTWSHRDGFYIMSFSGSVNVSDEEAQHIEEVMNGE